MTTKHPNGEINQIATREAFGMALAELGVKQKKIVVLDADLSNSTKTNLFQKSFPQRFFQMGIAEQNMIGAAAGLALQGLIPVVSTFAAFACRAWEQFRLSIAVPNLNVKLVTTHSGITVGEDGVSAQMTEDIALMRSLPNVTVIVPADAFETKQALKAAIEHRGPVYMRLGRLQIPIVMSSKHKFKIGQACLLRQGQDVSIIATGFMVSKAIKAANILELQGIKADVINLSTIKPLDQETILRSTVKTGAVVTAEEHQQAGGMGSAVSEFLSQTLPVPIEMVAIQDAFGESGKPDELLTKFGLTSNDIVLAVNRVLSRKRSQELNKMPPLKHIFNQI